MDSSISTITTSQLNSTSMLSEMNASMRERKGSISSLYSFHDDRKSGYRQRKKRTRSSGVSSNSCIRRVSLYFKHSEFYDKRFCLLQDLKDLKVIGTGTFGCVKLVKYQKQYYALKLLPISRVFESDQVKHVKQERKLLACISHPFIIKLFWSYHTNAQLYLLFEFAQGGELFFYMRKHFKFTEDTARFYICEIASALQYLHSLSIAYRDLKPENCLLNSQGHIRITDFGFAKYIYNRSYTLCGTPDYLAPEQLTGYGHNCSVDLWALGVLLYEMLCGHPPFGGKTLDDTFDNILSGSFDFSVPITLPAKSLIRGLLQPRHRRLGVVGPIGWLAVTHHEWFADVDWAVVVAQEMKPPIVPRISSETDTKNYDCSVDATQAADLAAAGRTVADTNQVDEFADF